MKNNCLRSVGICFVTHLYPVDKRDYKGGFVHDLAVSFSRKGYKVHVVTPLRPGALKNEYIDGVHIHRFHYWGEKKGIQLGRLKGTPLLLLGTLVLSGIMECIKVVVKYNTDIIHAYWVVPGGLIAVTAGFFTGKPVVATAAGSDLNIALKKKIYRLFICLTLKGLDRLIAVSALMKQIAVSLGLCEEKAVVFPGPAGIDFDLYTDFSNKGSGNIDESVILNTLEDSGKSYDSNIMNGSEMLNCADNTVDNANKNQVFNDAGIDTGNNTVKLLYAGNLTPPKRVDTLLKAMKIAVGHIDNINLVIVGDGEKRNELEELSKKLCIDDKVVFKGAVSHDEIPGYMREADIFVHCSENEGLPVAIMEAMAAGLPVVAGEVGGIPELISDNETGYLVHYDDYEKYAEKIILLAKNNNLRSQIGRKGRVYALETFSRPVIVNKNMEIYRHIIG